MAYFGGAGRFAGDPGFFDTLKGIGRGALGIVSGGTSERILSAFSRPRAQPAKFQARQFPPSRRTGAVPAISDFLLGPPAQRKQRAGLQVMADGTVRRKSRRMNVGNTKALSRAIRRTDGFVNLSRRALKNTGFKIVSKSAGKMTEAAWQKKAHHAK